MREILFRGKRIDNGEWIYGYYVYSKSEDECFILPQEGFNTKVYHDTVGQYTGLTDKNGNKIFEGDIVRINESISKSKRMGVVIYDETKGQTCIDVGDGCKKYSFERKIIIKDGKCTIENSLTFEIIGNIYDNPELTKGDKQ